MAENTYSDGSDKYHLWIVLVQVFHMYESDAYPFASETITQTLFFPQPLVTTKIRIDNMVGASGFVFQVEILGMNQEAKAKQFNLPFEGGTVFTSKIADILAILWGYKIEIEIERTF